MIYLERNTESRLKNALNSPKGYGPLVGGLVGSIPQCGFSVAAADMFNRHKITVGTLIAVFISTSDEAIPVLLSTGGDFLLIGGLILTKLIIGISIGLLVDKFWVVSGSPIESHTHVEASHDVCGCSHKHNNIVLTALKHTAIIFVLIFVVSFVFEIALELIGTDAIASLMLSGSVLQPMIVAAIGFVPNCATSIVIAQLLAEGAISFGSAIAGLITGAGFGIIVLLRGTKDRRLVIKILGLIYIVAVVSGMVLQFLFP